MSGEEQNDERRIFLKPKYKINMIAGGVLFLFGLAYFILTWQIANFKGLGAPPVDAKFVPRLWGGLLMFLSLIVFIRGIREYLRLRKEGKIEKKKTNLIQGVIEYREVILSFLFLLIYILLLQPVGFIIMSALFIFAEAMVLTPKGKRKPLIAAIVGIVAAVVVDFAFVTLLHVLLPAGILGW